MLHNPRLVSSPGPSKSKGMICGVWVVRRCPGRFRARLTCVWPALLNPDTQKRPGVWGEVVNRLGPLQVGGRSVGHAQVPSQAPGPPLAPSPWRRPVGVGITNAPRQRSPGQRQVLQQELGPFSHRGQF